jgi:zinc transport system ATP-binding protein
MNLQTAPAVMPLIAAEALSVSFGGEQILDHVDLSIRPREIVTLIGPNGSGKTTLIRALLGLVSPASGRVVRHSKAIAYVPQFFARDRSLPLTALGFVQAFGKRHAGEAQAALYRTGMAHAAERQLSSLSGGEMARVALARAILRRPEAIGAGRAAFRR